MIATTMEKHIPAFKVLHRHHSFALLWSGQFVSALGDGIYKVALAWTVLQLTGSALALGAVIAATLVPTLLLMLLGGVAADRLPRRQILLCSDAGRAVAVGVIAVLAALHVLQFWHLFVLALLFEIADSFFSPAYQAFIPQLVEVSLLQPANSLVQFGFQLSRMVGPALGAIIVATMSGGTGAFVLDALSFAFSAGYLVALRPPQQAALSPAQEQDIPSSKPRGGILADVREGLCYVCGTRWLWVIILIAAFINITYSAPFASALPKLVHDVYGGGPALFGLLVAADAAGSLIATIILGFVHIRRRGTMAYSVLLLCCLSLVLLGLPLPHVSEPIVATIACACAGFGLGFFSLIEMTLLQEFVPEQRLGRVISLDMLGSYALLPFGLLIIGGVTDIVGPATIFIIGGLLSMALVASGLCVRDIRTLA
jgi:MFS family permease